jgi:hypothetical protein
MPAKACECWNWTSGEANAEKRGKAAFSAFRPQLRRNQTMNILTKPSD